MKETTPFRCFLIVRNPASTNAHTAARRIHKLQQAFPNIECIVVDTEPRKQKAITGLLRPFVDKLGKDTLLCIAGGDGTINMVLENLLNDPKLPARARQTPLLPLWGGNANDLAHMLNGRARLASLPSLIHTGTMVKVFPLVCRLTDSKDRTRVHIAACYASFGASATTTQVLSRRTARARTALSLVPPIRFVGELFIVIPAMSRASTFKAIEDGRQKTIYEYVFFNGPRFAKVSGIKRNLTDQTFHRVIVDHKRLSDVLLSALALTRRTQVDKFETTHAAFTTTEATWSQFDGEALRVAENTNVSVAIGRRPFYAFSTRIKDPAKNT